MQPLQVLAQAGKARRRHVDGGDMRTGGNQAGRLPAGGGAQVGNGLPRHVAGNARHQRGGRVLHPPGALAIAGQVLDAAARRQPDGARRQQTAAEALGPALRVGLRTDVERRLFQARLGDAARDALAIGGAPALPQPIGNIEAHAILAAQQLRPALGDPAQDGVGELGEAMRRPIASRRLDGEIDDRVRGHVETDELRRAGQQDRPEIALVRRQRALQEDIEHMLELALPAQHGGRHGASERAVSGLQRRHLGPRRGLGQHLIERPLVHENACNEAHRQAARGQTRRHGRARRHLLLGRHGAASFVCCRGKSVRNLMRAFASAKHPAFLGHSHALVPGMDGA